MPRNLVTSARAFVPGTSRRRAASPCDTDRPTDDELMVRFAAGDPAAFDQLYARYERRVFGFCLRMLEDAEHAADAFQETFVKVVDARRQFEARGRFASWIFTVARRACLDRVRDIQRVGRVENAVRLGRANVVDPPATGARDELDRMLAVLSPTQREIIILNKQYGFTYSEIATMTQTTEEAVKQKAYRALQRLRAEFGSS